MNLKSVRSQEVVSKTKIMKQALIYKEFNREIVQVFTVQ